jgi:hypothetical protein
MLVYYLRLDYTQSILYPFQFIINLIILSSDSV